LIKSFQDKTLEKCWHHGDCHKINSDLRRRVLIKLDSIDAASCLNDLKNPPGNNLHPLHGKEYEGCYAISVNGPWRLIFIPDNGDAYEVRLEQYH
jgi:proteic killer suppression protein